MLSDTATIARLALAAALGGAIGFERERLMWAAGLRTHMLVSVGACLIAIVSAYGFSDVLQPQRVVLDPSRIAAQVVSGIGFLGAGTILLRGEVIKGLTTAASLWAVAALGLACGTGMYVAAAAATCIILVILAGVKPIEERFRSRSGPLTIAVVCARRALTLQVLEAAAGPFASRVQRFTVQPSEDGCSDEATIVFTRLTPASMKVIAETLRKVTGVTHVAAT